MGRSLEARRLQGLGAAQQTDRAAHCLSRRRVCAAALKLSTADGCLERHVGGLRL